MTRAAGAAAVATGASPRRAVPTTAAIPLSEVRPGQTGWIDGYVVEDDAVLRLAEMGLVLDERVAVLKVAPLGDPMEIEVMGYRLCLRKKEAARIRIRLNP